MDGVLHADLGRGTVVTLPAAETQRRLQATTPQWPIMHAVLHGVGRDQLMARHKANHANVVYARDADAADRGLRAKAAMLDAMGCGCTSAVSRPVTPSAPPPPVRGGPPRRSDGQVGRVRGRTDSRGSQGGFQRESKGAFPGQRSAR